jgi:uncharacterized Tic20 family protein
MFAAVPAMMAAFLIWQVLTGLMTGRTWVGRPASDPWVDRDLAPINFWWAIIFNVVLAVFLSAEAIHLAGWINDPASYIANLYRETLGRALG